MSNQTPEKWVSGILPAELSAEAAERKALIEEFGQSKNLKLGTPTGLSATRLDELLKTKDSGIQ